MANISFMISVLIPVHNYLITPLVQSLHKQLTAEKIAFEIICLDDASKKSVIEKNQGVKSFSEVSYILSEKNNGRAITKELLCQNAKYQWVLFLDADVDLIDDCFISNYIHQIKTNSVHNFIFGGFAYKKEKPKNDYLLRWKYGQKYEAISAKIRNRKPYKVTIAANLLVKKEYYLKLNINSLGNNYGMDLLLGALLKENKESVLHINNPVYHLGIEKSIDYLKKKEYAAESLLELYRGKKIKESSNNLLKTFIFLKTLKCNYILAWLYPELKAPLKQNLTGGNPNMKLFQFYRITYLCSLDLKEQKPHI